MTVLACNNWTSNAELIEDCHRLGYLKDDDLVLDPTFENGTWWKRWSPETLVALNRNIDGSDFRHLHQWPDGNFDAIAYDPPYCSKGGRETSGIKEMDRRYGQEDAPKTPALLQVLINDGLTEMHRLVKRRGFVLVKCMDYISSGKLWPGVHLTTAHAFSLDFELVDRFEMWGSVRPQPGGRRQVHARRNHSTLLVFRKR